MRQRLVDHAVTLGQAQQRVELLVAGVAVDGDMQSNPPEADRNLFRNAQRAADIEIAFGLKRRVAQRDAERSRDGVEYPT